MTNNNPNADIWDFLVVELPPQTKPLTTNPTRPNRNKSETD